MALSERERFLHYMSLLSIFGVIEQIPKEVIMNLAMKMAKERCRKLTKEDIDGILGEMHEEQQAGKVAMDEILDRLLTNDKLRGIESGRSERFTKQPFDIFFFMGDEEEEK